jgi:crotonobetainyl-CoA:carnitine CoA-transferase CaiB-like acyl-CoA transferase
MYNRPTSERTNPAAGTYRTSDGRAIMFAGLQPGKWWPDLCRHIDRPDLVDDPRCRTVDDLLANAGELAKIVETAIASRPYAEWVERFRTLEAPWAPVQNALEVGNDPQLRANGYIASITDADGKSRDLMANPVQFDETPAQLRRAPQWAEHTDEILRELGIDDEAILKLRLADAIT